VGVRIGVDIGGTFTDAVATDGRRLVVRKIPSTPRDPGEGFEGAVREILRDFAGSAVDGIAHGSTVATNAVLERSGPRCALVTTDGFRDVLVIGRQDRPSLYDLFADRPAPLVARDAAFDVRERVAPDGTVLIALDEQGATRAARAIADLGASSVAVCLLFSFANPDHERRMAAILRDAVAGVHVSLSSEVLPEFREYERASTTALDAYVAPVVSRYLSQIARRVADLGAPITVMRSGGGTMAADRASRQPVHMLLSGPAAGVRGAALVAAACGFPDVVTFDMGGTSTDVCLVEGGVPEVAAGAQIGGLPFRTAALGVHTIGAGGGSILWADAAGVLRVGPASAGAEPGPACYGRGGNTPTVTDAHVLLGHLGDALGGSIRLDVAAAGAAIRRLAATLGRDPVEVAEAGLAVARSSMSAAIRRVTVERGRDPRGLALVAFGGAGPMHATALARTLEIPRVIVPATAGALSALGLLAAPRQHETSRTDLRPLADVEPSAWDDLMREAAAAVIGQGVSEGRVELLVDCRYAGQSHEVTIEGGTSDECAARFHAAHRVRFGWDAPEEPVEAVTFRARASSDEPAVSAPALGATSGAAPGERQARVGGRDLRARVLDRSSLAPGTRTAGPAIVEGTESTLILEDGDEAEVLADGTIVVSVP
jgi:N-methylhydantoinase A